MEGWTMMMQLDALFDGFLLRFGFTWVAFLIMLSVILYVFLVELKETMKGGCLLRIMIDQQMAKYEKNRSTRR